MSILGGHMYILCANMYIVSANMYILGANRYHYGTNMQPLGTKVYLLKWYSPSDSFCTVFFLRVHCNLRLQHHPSLCVLYIMT